MFTIAKSESYFWPVAVEYPVDGRPKKETFDAQFKRIKQSRIDRIAEEFQAGAITDVKQVVREVVLGWKGIVDEKGGEVAFSESALDELLDIPGVSAAIMNAFFESISGAKRKN